MYGVQLMRNLMLFETAAKLQTTASFSRFDLVHLQKQTPVNITFGEFYFEVYQGLWSASHPEVVAKRPQFCNGFKVFLLLSCCFTVKNVAVLFRMMGMLLGVRVIISTFVCFIVSYIKLS